MQKRRLENALNAGKLIQLGFGLNYSKPEKLSLLYTVDCINKNVNYFEQLAQDSSKKNATLKKNQNSQSESESDSDQEVKSESHSALSQSDQNDFEKVEILSLQFHRNQNLLATGDSNGEIQIYDVFSGIPISASLSDDELIKKSNFEKTYIEQKIPYTSVYNMPVICMKWHPYSNYTLNWLYYAHVNGFIGVMDKESFKKIVILEEKDEISCIDFSLDGSVLASVGKDYRIKLYDSNLNDSSAFNKLIKSYGTSNLENNSFFTSISSTLSSIISPSSTSSHSNRLQSVKFSNTSNDLIFTGGWDRTVKTWDKRTPNGYVNTLPGPFVCGSDAIDVNDYLVLTASWVKENALDLWDIRTFKKISNLPIVNKNANQNNDNLHTKLNLKESVNEYLYACKFFSSSNQVFKPEFDKNDQSKPQLKNITSNYSTVLACGSGTQSVHLIDYEQPKGKHLLASLNCQSPLYCLDAIYSCSLIACGGMKKFFTVMGKSS